MKPKDRKLDADAAIAEMQAAKMAGETLDAAEVRRVWEAFLARVRANLLGYADRAAPMVEEGMTLGERVAVLRVEMNESLRDIVKEQARIGAEEPHDQAP